MPPSGFSTNAVRGALQFIGSCYEDLLAEVQSGKHESVEAAIEYELHTIGTALQLLHINEQVELVERKDSS
jgi:hypothetical protein